MGKLHKLKRAILRNPSTWYNVDGAGKCGGEWEPQTWWGGGSKSYGSFIRSVLKKR